MSKEPKILIFDLETSPNVGYFWSAGHKISVGPENIVEERQVICIGYKWLGQKRTHALQWNYKKGAERDAEMLAEFAEIYAEADMVVAHNGDNFDIKWLKTRIMYHDLDPLPPVQQCDTFKEFRKNFRLNSNRLDYVAKFLGSDGKSPMSFQDWKDVMAGSTKALNKMVKYCKKDVELLEEIYLRTRRHLKDHGIMQSIKGDKRVCPQCGSDSVYKHTPYVTKAGRYQRYRCQMCAKTWKDTRMIKDNK